MHQTRTLQRVPIPLRCLALLALGAHIAVAEPLPVGAPTPSAESCALSPVMKDMEWWQLPNQRKILRWKSPRPSAVREWQQSAVSEEMIAENLISLPETACDPASNRVTHPIREILGCGVGGSGDLYPLHPGREAWTTPGYDPLTLEEKHYYEVKPLPKLREKKKYEHVVKRSPALLRIPVSVARTILGKASVPRNLVSTDAVSKFFWRRVIELRLPIVLTEGTKKAASLLSAGLIGVSIPGACNGLEYAHGTGNNFSVSLVPELEPFLGSGRKITIAFDHDPFPRLRGVIQSNAVYLGRALEAHGASVFVLELPGPAKAVDDYIVAHGAPAFNELLKTAVPLKQYGDPPFTLEQISELKWCSAPSDPLCPD